MNHTPQSLKDALARRAFLRLIGQGFTVATFGTLTASSLTGCGGGGHSRSGSSATPSSGIGTPTPAPGTPTPVPTATPTSGPLTPESRAAAIQAVNSQMDAFRNAGNVTDQQVVDYLKTLSVFEDAGSIKPGGAWARFTDGHVFIVSRNFVEPDPDKDPTGRYVPQAATRAVGQELPQTDRIHIFNALGTAFTPPHEDIRLWMIRHGYTLAPEREATIEALKTISGDGVFYINTHGDYGRTRDNVDLWAMWTADEVSPEKDAQYADLLADGSLVRFSAIHDKAPIQNPFNDAIEGNTACHYAITQRFVQKFNWQFGANSFVFLNCCWSADTDFYNVCRAHGAATYAGWTNASNPPQAWRAARFLFDRLLGQLQGVNNEYPEAGGPQRAFDLAPVFADLRKRGWEKTHTSFGDGELIYGPNTSNFGLLAPSIQYVEVDEFNKKLILHGKFGMDPGVGIRYVRIEGTDLNVTKWENERIEADITPDQYGDVWVQIVARKSNIRQLTRWEGTLDYDAKGPETLHMQTHIQYRIRADVGKFRNEPAGALQDRQIEVYSVFEPAITKAHFTYSGQADLFAPDGRNSFFTQWTGDGDLGSTNEFGPSDNIRVRITIDTATRQMRMGIFPFSTSLFKVRQYGKFDGEPLGGQSPDLNPYPLKFADEVFSGTEVINGTTLHYLALTCDSNWNLTPETHKVDAPPPTDILIGFLNGQIEKIPTTITWSAASPAKPPRETESRSRAKH